MERVLAGTLAGLAATAPMTAVMLGAHRELPWYQKHGLPPRLITSEMLDRLVPDPPGHEAQHQAITLAAHVGYGAAVGAGFGMMTQNSDRMTGMAKGVGYGLAVWGLSYLGWLPLMRMRAAAPNESLRRNAMMIVAHVVWGLSAGLLTEQLATRRAR